MKLLLYGGSGQLGFELCKRAEDLNFELVSPHESEVDICDRDQLKFLANEIRPDVIVNAAAYTAVDQAEEEEELAFRVNRDGAKYVAESAQVVDARVIHLSTDYVFSGEGGEPLMEDDKTDPISVYGQSKLAGEEEVLTMIPDSAVVVRTSSLHGKMGQNFVHTMVDLFHEREVVQVVNDQTMSPTWAGWLAEAVLDLCRVDRNGVVHACSGAAVTWFDFASEILEIITPALKEGHSVSLEPVSTEEFPRPAPRPRYSVMDVSKLEGILGRSVLPWREGLRAHLYEMGYGSE